MDAKTSQTALVGIRDLEVWCIIGVRERERGQEQRLLVDISLAYDAGHAAESDRLQDAVDYSLAADHVRELLREGRFELLERASVSVARGLLQRFPQSTEVEVTLKKPEAIADARCAYAMVRVRQES